MRDLVRTIRLSLSYRAAISATLVCAALFSASRYAKTWLAKPFLDEVVPAMSQGGIDWAALAPRLWEIGTILALTLVVTPPVMFLRLYLANWVVGRTRQDVDQRVARKFLSAPLRLHRGEASGELLSRALTDAQLACRTLEVLYKDVVEDFMLLVGGVIAMFLLSWQLSLLSMTTMPILLGVLAYFGNQIQKKTQRRQETQSDLSQRLIAILSGIKVIKAFRGEEVELAAFGRETQTYFRRHMKVIFNRAMAKTTSESVNQLVGALILGVGTYFALNRMFDVTFGTLGAFALMLVQVYKPIKSLTISFTTIMESNAGAQRLFEVFDMEEEPPDRPDAKTMTGLMRGIRFRDVHFDYGQGAILAGIDLEVKPGEVIAIVGRTGTGKSTLMDLLLRFHDPTQGRIEIDGVDLRDLKRKSFLDHVAVVTQEPFLFDASILENIRYGKPDVPFEKVRAAAIAASAEEFIDELPQGYDTPVGEFGLRLSGGQRQRITIARAILADPAILVFDEATSSLDAKTERAVQLAIESLRGQRTIFLVAHRLTTIRHADRIVVLDQGRIVDIGDHETLLARPGIYRELIGADRPSAA
ncbi:MAG: ABC transporter ATP-binding protein [Deltaproteobacteria bacterium]|nr:ABC transporter ATP-binding protein [Deltaproteobacteria bacterium]